MFLEHQPRRKVVDPKYIMELGPGAHTCSQLAAFESENLQQNDLNAMLNFMISCLYAIYSAQPPMLLRMGMTTGRATEDSMYRRNQKVTANVIYKNAF